jgi:hypothetical protein
MNFREAWERVGIRPRRVAILLLIGLPLVLGTSDFARSVLPTCNAREKAALAEFPQYGGRVAGKNLDISGDELNWPPLQSPGPGCTLELETRASPGRVSRYYYEQLSEHGWKVKRIPSKNEGGIEYAHVDGYRQGLHYDVSYFWFSGSTSAASEATYGEDHTSLSIEVYEPPPSPA